MRRVRALVLGMIGAVAASASHAMTVSAVRADCDSIGLPATTFGVGTGCSSDPLRTDPGKVNFGSADGKFYSLGIGGGLVLQLTPSFTGPAVVVEVTNAGTNHREAAEVFGSVDALSFVSLGIINNIVSGSPVSKTSTLTFSGIYKYLAFLDVSKTQFPGTGTQDGFDIDAFTVKPVPVPMPLALIATGLIGFGLMRRRRMTA